MDIEKLFKAKEVLRNIESIKREIQAWGKEANRYDKFDGRAGCGYETSISSELFEEIKIKIISELEVKKVKLEEEFSAL